MNKISSKITKLFLIAAITTSLAAVPTAQARKSDEPSIVDIALSDMDNFSTLVGAVVKAGLVETLDGNRQFTVFAPTNTAFDAAAKALIGLEATGADLVAATSAEDLRAILLYHVAPGNRPSEDVTSATRVRTVSMQFIGVEGTTLVGIGSSANLNLDAIDITARNGVIHVIDFVLLPF